MTEIETIAISESVRMLLVLRRRFGPGRWRKRQGFATVCLADEDPRRAEIRWFEAPGIGRALMRIKRFLDEQPMSEQPHVPEQFAICIKTDDADLLTPRRI